MTFPINLHIGNLVLPSHLIFELLSFFVGYRYYSFLRAKQTDKISDPNRLWIIIGAAGGALLFSRLLGILENPTSIQNLNAALSNKTIIGGLLGGLLGVEIIKKIISEKNSSGDLFTFPLITGIAIGRIGCFLSGLEDHTYGNETSLPIGIDFGDGINRHPTNLYEIIFLVFLFAVLKFKWNDSQFKSGALFKIFMTSYLLFRFLIEFIKPREYSILDLSVIQIACLLGLVYYYRVIVSPKRMLHA